jgi:hypothetical protein
MTTIKEVQDWCRANKVDAHGYVRGGEFHIRHADGNSASPPSGEVLHWEVTINGQSCPSSTSDMERLVSGKIPPDDFLKIMTRRSGRAE